ncbi:DUF4133 domain-containing protein [Sediminibacterium roseum]|uniref:DUF4133 domain-containing protein n=1 Tax=Sediminibacterium roseum TaxID=1978412 RepID=A0ABW9ZYJ5_9BACT|nr:DUF4133 domain-containing protein [Sediminibacterium roseum]NCI51304.1 DUF4133 domain-containing protein [Sediminibacterium roseum]
MSSVYEINKGIGKPVVFKGLKAQWIWWLGGGIVGLLLLFAVMYLAGVSMGVCVFVIGVLGSGLFVLVYRLSRKYGEHGLMKAIAFKSVPKRLKGVSDQSIRKNLCDEKSKRNVTDLGGRK